MRHVPLLFFPFLLYNAFAFLIFADPAVDFREAAMFRLTLPSDAGYTLPVGTVIVLFALLLLGVELLKASRTPAPFVDHAFRVVLFAAFALEFALVKEAATDPFLTLFAISLVDVACGLAISPRPLEDYDDLA
jgi:hypothetical protein